MLEISFHILVMTFIAVFFIGWLETDGGRQKLDKWAKTQYEALMNYWKEKTTPVLCRMHSNIRPIRKRNVALVYDAKCQECRKQKF